MQLVVAQPVGEGHLVSVRQRHLEVFILEGDGDLQGEDVYPESLGKALKGAWVALPRLGLEVPWLGSPLTSP